jgi:hypothetical protein
MYYTHHCRSAEASRAYSHLLRLEHSFRHALRILATHQAATAATAAAAAAAAANLSVPRCKRINTTWKRDWNSRGLSGLKVSRVPYLVLWSHPFRSLQSELGPAGAGRNRSGDARTTLTHSTHTRAPMRRHESKNHIGQTQLRAHLQNICRIVTAFVCVLHWYALLPTVPMG